MKSQKQLYYAAEARAGERDATFMELVNHPTNPLTREDLLANIARHPALWSRYAGFADKLPLSTPKERAR
jgi:hypothetical protein